MMPPADQDAHTRLGDYIRDHVLAARWELDAGTDTTRIRTLVGPDSRLVDIAAGLLFALPATPMLT